MCLVITLPDVPAGAQWLCVDLHVHTPGIHSFALPPGLDVRLERDREKLADEYVGRLAQAGIDVVALTDYQGVRPEWYGLIRDRRSSGS
jgi:hypothetical protein